MEVSMSFKEFLVEQQILLAPMNEMANLYPAKTGLAYVIWFGEVGGQHGPRIKVSNVKGKFAINDNFVISVAKDPIVLTPKARKISNSDLEDLFDWVKLNYNTLMQLWKIHESGDGDTDSVYSSLEKI